ncbi:MAG: HTTM domain-containing protein [Ignavibacteria bacterium]|jgi:hypothetical protein
MNSLIQLLHQPASAYTLAYFRMGLGMLILISTLRFLILGWVDLQYVEPLFHFPYFGLEFLSAPSTPMIYATFGILIISSICVIIGYRFRIMSIFMFLSFTYIELWDIAFYLNHYYAVSLFALILSILPAHVVASLDAKSGRVNNTNTVPFWTHFIVFFQIGIIYVYAGIAKINIDWLYFALPLKIWLPAHTSFPVIGPLLALDFTAYVFAWFGMLYDLFIIAFLIYPKTRYYAFATVVIFHSMTGFLFQIGVFPIVMIFMATLFFEARIHEYIIQLFFVKSSQQVQISKHQLSIYGLCAIGIFMIVQLIVPFRYLLYPGHYQWTEQGYRFGWRVMLTEKSGIAQFSITDKHTGKKGYVNNAEWLTPHQEKQMAFQPDMILAFAHFLHDEYKKRGVQDPIVNVDCWVTMNGRPSARLIDPTVDLSVLHDDFCAKSWISAYPGAMQ